MATQQENDIKQWLDSGSINIFGRQFSGKDTQGRILCDLFDGVLLGGGEILRNSVIPEHVMIQMHAGLLVPTKDYIDIVLPYLSRDILKGKPLILSAIGRRIGEEEGVIEAAKASHHPLKAVIYLKLDEDVARERWHTLKESADRGERQDETLEALETRLQEFRDKTIPVIEAYRALGLLIEVNANQSVESVTAEITSALANRASTSP